MVTSCTSRYFPVSFAAAAAAAAFLAAAAALRAAALPDVAVSSAPSTSAGEPFSVDCDPRLPFAARALAFANATASRWGMLQVPHSLRVPAQACLCLLGPRSQEAAKRSSGGFATVCSPRQGVLLRRTASSTLLHNRRKNGNHSFEGYQVPAVGKQSFPGMSAHAPSIPWENIQ